MRMWREARQYMGLVVVIIIGVAAYVYFGGDETVIQTIRAEKGEFIRQVSVSGKVVAEEEADLGFAQSGRIAHVYVREGQEVRRGALLAEIENDDLRAQLVQRQSALEREEAELDALTRGARPEEIAVSESAVKSAEVSLAVARRALIDAVSDAYTKSDSAIHTSGDQLLMNPQTASPMLLFPLSDAQLRATIEAGRRDMETLLARWFSTTRFIEPEAAYEAAVSSQKDLGAVSVYLLRLSEALSAAIPTSSYPQATLDSLKTEIDTARASLNAANSALTTALKAEASAETTLDTARKNLALTISGASEENVRAQRAVIKAAEADVMSVRAQLAETQILAPFAGTVTRLDAKIGSLVSPQVPQVSLIGNGVFQIESFVPELNVGFIEIGDTAAIEFDAYSGERFTAQVISIDIGETVRDSVSTYRTMLAFETLDKRIRSGMTANVRITTDLKQGVVQVPQGVVVRDNGDDVVYLARPDAPERRVVQLGGVSSLGTVEVLSGLVGGEELVVPDKK